MMSKILAPLAAALLAVGAGGAGSAGRAARVEALPEIAAMDTMIREAYRAEAAYRRVLRDFGPVAPFASIVHDEDLHAELLAALYRGRGLAPPAREDHADAYRTVAEACASAAEAESRAAALYAGFLAAGVPEDVRRVFEHNGREAAGSRAEAFRRCGG